MDLGSAGFRALRRRCTELLDDVDVPVPFDLPLFCQRLAAHRGRPLQVLSLPMQQSQAGLCGVWVATDTQDWVIVEPGTSPLHQAVIALHEIGHVLAGHRADNGWDGVVARMLPHLDPATVRSVLGRSAYRWKWEREAEMIATLVLARAQMARAPTPAGGLDELSRALGG